MIARAVLSFAGCSEPALRIVPWLAAFSGIVILAVVLRRLFSPPAAFVGFAIIVCNYWIIKYSQQVKQYGTDLLIACLMLLMLDRIVRDGRDLTDYVRLGLLGFVSSFLSFTSVFWFASCVIAVSLPNRVPGGVAGEHAGRLRFRRAIALVLLLAACLGLNYFVFIRPNLTAAQFGSLAMEFFDVTHMATSLRRLQHTIGDLLVPLSSPLAQYTIWLIEVLMVFGTYRAIRFSLQGDRTALVVLLAGPVPIVVVILVSATRLYPILYYTRMLIWMIPCSVVLVSYALTPALGRIASLPILLSSRLLLYAVPAACLSVVLLSQVVFFAFPGPPKRTEAQRSSSVRTHTVQISYSCTEG